MKTGLVIQQGQEDNAVALVQGLDVELVNRSDQRLAIVAAVGTDGNIDASAQSAFAALRNAGVVDEAATAGGSSY
jgi:hypothetical protein